jgi:hypothetical protein
MKKRMVLFLMGFALAATAFVSTPVAAGPSSLCPTQGFACLIGPICCFDQTCAAFCQGRTPHCSGSPGNPGCCSCGTAEI